MVFQPQDVRQGLRAAVLKLGQSLADHVPHHFGGDAGKSMVHGQNAPFLDKQGADQTDPALLVPIHPAIQGQGRFLGDLGLQPGLIEPDHRHAARFVAQAQGHGGEPPKAAQARRGLGIAGHAHFHTGGDFGKRGDSGRILIPDGQGQQKIRQGMNPRLTQRVQTGFADALQFLQRHHPVSPLLFHGCSFDRRLNASIIAQDFMKKQFLTECVFSHFSFFVLFTSCALRETGNMIY